MPCSINASYVASMGDLTSHKLSRVRVHACDATLENFLYVFENAGMAAGGLQPN